MILMLTGEILYVVYYQVKYTGQGITYSGILQRFWVFQSYFSFLSWFKGKLDIRDWPLLNLYKPLSLSRTSAVLPAVSFSFFPFPQ